MKKMFFISVLLMFAHAAMAQPVVDEALKTFSEGGKLKFDAQRGKAFWTKKFPAKDGKDRQCATCHGEDLTKTGKHAKSGKLIEPMAPSVNPQRYTEMKKINKWLKRNCKWTVGRECTNQEKGDLLKYLSQQ